MRGVVTPGGNTEPPEVPDPPAPSLVALELVPPAPVLVSVAVVELPEVSLAALALAPPVSLAVPVVPELLLDPVAAAVELEAPLVVDAPAVVLVVLLPLPLLLLAAEDWLEVSPLSSESDAEQATALVHRMAAPRRRVLEVNIEDSANGLPLLAKAIREGRGAPSQILQTAC